MVLILSEAFECDKVMCDNGLLFKITSLMQVESMYRIASAFAVCLVLTFATFAQTGFTIDNLIATKRVGDPQLSPDGRTVAFTVGTVDKAENRTLTHIYTIRVDGTNLKQVSSGDRSNSSPRWSPDGTRIAYTTGGQVWTSRFCEPPGERTRTAIAPSRAAAIAPPPRYATACP